jgi:SWI/SNF-related matrix-associated actin-dependent regulator of chromatin subfamily A-like protein 1
MLKYLSLMLINYEEGRYFATCTYEERLQFRNAGWTFSTFRKRWETQRDVLADTFIDYAVGHALVRLNNIRSLNAELTSASSAVDTDTNFWHPEGEKYLGFQKAGIEYMLGRDHNLLADEPGTGKTVQSLAVFTNTTHAKSLLIIAPASLKYNWLREARKWLRKGQTVGVTETKAKTVKTPLTHMWPDKDVVITTYDMLEQYRPKIHERVWDLMVCDEAHLLSNPKAIRTKNVFGGGRGKKRIEAIPTRRSIFATGTPILKRPVDLWPILQRCDPNGLGADYMHFTRRYCGAYQNHFGWITDGADNLDELQFKLRSTCMLRRQKKDVLKELPDKIRQIIELPPEGTKKLVKKELEVFEKNLERLLSVNEEREYSEDVFQTVSLDVLSKFIDEATSRAVEYSSVHNQEYELEDYIKLHFEAMSIAREEIGLAKVPMVLEYARRITENGDKVVIMCVHKAVAYELQKHFNNCALITGKVSAKKRDAEVHRFQSDPDCMVFIGNIAAAGVGITLTSASNLVFAELSWSPAEMEQAEDRIHRIGQEQSAHIHYLVIRGSMEAGVIDKLIEKQEIINKALNNS